MGGGGREVAGWDGGGEGEKGRLIRFDGILELDTPFRFSMSFYLMTSSLKTDLDLMVESCRL